MYYFIHSAGITYSQGTICHTSQQWEARQECKASGELSQAEETPTFPGHHITKPTGNGGPRWLGNEPQITQANSQCCAFVSRLMQNPLSCQPSALCQILLTQCCAVQNSLLLFMQPCTCVTPSLTWCCYQGGTLLTYLSAYTPCRGNQQGQALPFTHTCRNVSYLESRDEKKPNTTPVFLSTRHLCEPPPDRPPQQQMLVCGINTTWF